MSDDSPTQRRSRLFTVRIWAETADGGVEHRGQARDAETGAFRGFRRWSELTTFLSEQMDEHAGREAT